MENIKLPKKLKGASYNYTFAYCYNLKSVLLPDEIEGIGDISDMSDMFFNCYNIKEILFHSDKSHFKYDCDSILYYDSIPFIFNKCTSKTWAATDSSYYFSKNGQILDKNHFTINIIPKALNGWRRYKGNLYLIKSIKIENSKDSILELPPTSSNEYFIYGNLPNLKEIHTPAVDPNSFELEFPVDANDIEKFFTRKKITLYVPNGRKEAYKLTGKYDQYKDIKEDPLIDKYTNAIYLYSNYVSLFFLEKPEYYTLIAIGLGLIFLLFYILRMKQMKKTMFKNRKSALAAGFSGIIVSVIGFIPIYYLVFIYLSNHTKMEYNLLWIISMVNGCISACICSYIFVFANKGSFWNLKKKRK